MYGGIGNSMRYIGLPMLPCRPLAVQAGLVRITMALPVSSKRHGLALPQALHPLTNRNFSVFWLGAFLSNIGFWIQTVGQGWQVLQLTNSALLLGLVTFAATLPNIVLSLFGGVISDRMNRRYLLLGTQALYMVTATILGIFTTLHIITVWQIVLLALINGVFSAVGFPAWQTFIGDLVPQSELKQGIALNSMQFNLSRVLGPAIGGLSVGLLGIAGSYYLNAISYIAVIVPLFFMHPIIHQSKNKANISVWRGLREGLLYAKARPALQLVLLLQFMIAFFVFPYATLLPIFAGNIFHIGATGLGLLNAAAGVGALLGSILIVVLSQRMESKRSRTLLMSLCITGGIVSMLFSLIGSVNVALLLLIVLGASTVMVNIVTNTFIQSETPIEIRGRVVSIWITITFGIAPFGSLVAGWVAQMFGARLTLAAGGAICAFIVLLIVIWRLSVNLSFITSYRQKFSKK